MHPVMNAQIWNPLPSLPSFRIPWPAITFVLTIIMDDYETRRSTEMSEDGTDCHDDIQLLPSNDQNRDKSRNKIPAPRRRNVYALCAILLLSLVVNISQGVWLAGDAMRFLSGENTCKT